MQYLANFRIPSYELILSQSISASHILVAPHIWFLLHFFLKLQLATLKPHFLLDRYFRADLMIYV